MDKSIKKNYVFNLLYQVFNMITPLITTPYVARVLGADGIGIYSYIAAIVSNFILVAGLGTSVFGQREIAYSRDDRYNRTVKFWGIETLSLISVAISLVVYLVFISFQHENHTVFLFCTMNIIAIAFDITWFFAGLEEFVKITIRNMVFKLINILLVFAFVNTASDLERYVFIINSIPVLTSISLWLYLPKFLCRISVKEIKPIKYLRGSIELLIPTIAIQVYSVLDKVMLGILTGNEFENGYYDQAYKITRMVLTVIAAFGTVMIPRIGYYFNKQKYEEMRELLLKGFNYAWFISIPCALGLAGCASNMVPWFWGDGFDKVVPLMQILSIIIVCVGMNNVTGMQYLIPTGKQKQFTFTVCCGALVNFLLNILLIPKYLSIGAAVASVIAESVVLATELYCMRQEISIWKILKLSKNYVISGLIMFFVLLIEGRLLNASILNSLIMVVSGALVYISVLLVMKDAFFFTLLDSVTHKFRNK